jgi:hypothetical protein
LSGKDVVNCGSLRFKWHTVFASPVERHGAQFVFNYFLKILLFARFVVRYYPIMVASKDRHDSPMLQKLEQFESLAKERCVDRATLGKYIS